MSPLVRLDTLQQFQAVNLLLDQGHIPGPVVIPQTMAIVLVWQLMDQKTAHNVLHARYPGTFPGSVAMANTLLASISANLTSSGLTLSLNPFTNLNMVWLRDINTAGQPFILSDPVDHFGTAGGTALPDEASVCLTLRTSMAGPGHRGRFYVPGFASDAMGSGNTIAAPTVTSAGTWGTAVRTSINAQGVTHVLALPERAGYTSIRTGRVHPPRPAGTQDITRVECRDNHWDTQRRRGLK